MKNIFVVETPLQLLCAYEFISSLSGQYCLILRFSGVGRNDCQMEMSAKKLGLTYRTIYIRTHHAYGDFILGVFGLADVFFVKYEILFLGSYFSKFLMKFGALIFSKKKYILDDGVATLLAQKKMREKGPVFDLATFFDIPLLGKQKKISHSFEAIRKKFSLGIPDGNYFIGQILVERNFLSLSDYIDLVKSAKDQIDGTLFYYPHRAESTETIDKVSQIPGINIVYQDTCIEIEFLSNKIYPKNIFACLSTAIITLSVIFPKTAILSIIPNTIKSSNSPHFQDILNDLKLRDNVRIVYLIDGKIV